MTKQELRKVYLQKRVHLKESEYQQLNNSLCENFVNAIDLSTVKVLHSFLPIVKNREPDTWLIIKEVQQNHPQIKIAVPKINREGVIESYYLEESKLAVNSWGIPEPVGGALIEPEDVDMTLVPLLTFDKQGHRVGYGKGYYDRFLKNCRADSQKIGLSFFPPEEKIEGIFSDDFTLDMVVTPDKLFRFSI